MKSIQEAALEKAEQERDEAQMHEGAKSVEIDFQNDCNDKLRKCIAALEAELKEVREKANAALNKQMDERNEAVLERIQQQTRAESAEARATALQERGDSLADLSNRFAIEGGTLGKDLAASRKQVAELTEELAKHKAAFTPNGALARENEELREKLNLRPLALSVGQLAGKHEQALARITALEAALGFYADESHWDDRITGSSGGENESTMILNDHTIFVGDRNQMDYADGWDVAQAALAPASAPTETEKEQ